MKNIIITAILGISLTLTTAEFSHAEKKNVSLDDVIKEALDKSPIAKSIEAQRAFKEGDAFDVRTLPNPNMDTGMDLPVADKAEGEKKEYALTLSQSFRLSHGSLRNRLSDLINDAAKQNKDFDILKLLNEIRLSYGRAWVMQERKKVLTELLPKSKSLREFVDKGIKEGAYGNGDAAVFRSEVAKTEADLKGVSAEYLFSMAELSRLTGSSFEGVILAAPSLESYITGGSIKEKLTNSEFNVLKRAKILVDLAKADLAVANRDIFPELTPKLSYGRHDDGTSVVGVGISIPLPFYSQNNAERIRKEAEYNAASSSFEYTKSGAFQKAVTDTVDAFVLTKEETLLYQKTVIPSLKEALSAYEAQVRNGEGSIFQLWQTLREFFDSNERYLEIWTKAFSKRAELTILLGEEI